MLGNALQAVTALYEVINQYSREVRRDRRLAVPPADSATVDSRLCGSQLTLDAHIENRRVREIGYRVRACSLGQTTTAIVARRAPGLNAPALQRIGEQLRAILAGHGQHCDWPELEVFAQARDMPSRHGSAMLPFEALRQLFDRAGDTTGPNEMDVDLTNHTHGSN